MILEEKQILRTAMLANLAEFSRRESASASLRRHLRSTPIWEGASVIYGFHPLRSEPDWLGSDEISGKQIAYPRTDADLMDYFVAGKMVPGAHGPLEPREGIPAPPPDVILVPGLAFTHSGHRLGRGGGYFDRWLASRRGIPTVGICFSCQLVDSLPVEPHDLRVDAIVTEAGLLEGLENLSPPCHG